MNKEDTMKYTLNIINEWLKWAEIKMGVLLTTDIAIILAIISIVEDKLITSYKNQLVSYLFVIILLLLGSTILICFSSFWPNLKKVGYKENILFWNDIGDIGNGLLYINLLDKCLENGGDGYLNMLSSEIVANSKICKIKYQKFKVGVVLNIIGIIFLVYACFHMI